MRWLTLFPIVLASVAWAGCASDRPELDDVAASPLKLAAAEQEADAEDAIEGKEGVCRHRWRAVGFHPYTNHSTGIPFTDLCTIQRCDKCGATRHECERQRRARR